MKPGHVFFAVLAATLAACAAGSTAPASTEFGRDTLLVLDAIPSSGATNVSPNASITVTFNHAMMTGMEMLVMVHEGAVTGPAVAGTATWSADRRALTFTPTSPVKSKTTYVLHLSPNLTDARGDTINLGLCAGRVGGQSIPAAMMGGSTGMMSGGMGMGSNGMTGTGWRSGPGMWGYGMTLMFTTS